MAEAFEGIYSRFFFFFPHSGYNFFIKHVICFVRPVTRKLITRRLCAQPFVTSGLIGVKKNALKVKKKRRVIITNTYCSGRTCLNTWESILRRTTRAQANNTENVVQYTYIISYQHIVVFARGGHRLNVMTYSTVFSIGITSVFFFLN